VAPVPVPRGVSPDFSQTALVTSCRGCVDLRGAPDAHRRLPLRPERCAGLERDGLARIQLPRQLILQAAAALGPTGVWAFAVIYPHLNLVVRYSARYDGRPGAG
jgi:hypothetical protein